MIIAQISDIHLGMEPAEAGALNAERLDTVLRDMFARDIVPDVLIVSGDLTDRGNPEAYQLVRQAFADFPIPVHLMLGNHDSRRNFLEAFPETPTADGFVQYALEFDELRVLLLDTLEEGRHGGGFCATRAAWLKARLDEAPDRPTLIICHHPPFATGIDWMTSEAGEDWRVNLDAALDGAEHVLAVVGGHIHRAMLRSRKGRVLASCPPVAPQLALCLAPIDPDVADGRPMVTDAAPGYALHQWIEGGILTHFCFAEDAHVLARFTPDLKPFIAHQLSEQGE